MAVEGKKITKSNLFHLSIFHLKPQMTRFLLGTGAPPLPCHSNDGLVIYEVKKNTVTSLSLTLYNYCNGCSDGAELRSLNEVRPASI